MKAAWRPIIPLSHRQLQRENPKSCKGKPQRFKVEKIPMLKYNKNLNWTWVVVYKWNANWREDGIIPIELSFRTYITFLNAPGLGTIGWNAPTGSGGTTNQQKALGKLSDHKRYTVRSVVIKNCYISIYKFDFPQRNVTVFTNKCNLQLITIWWGNDSAGSYLTKEIHSTKPEILTRKSPISNSKN